jgi:uncharacterized protein (TIGR02145 family)
MKKRTFLITVVLIIGSLIVLATGCKKDKKSGVPVLETLQIEYIAQKAAQSGGNITSNGGSMITIRGVCWSTHDSPTVSDYRSFNGAANGEFESFITGLTPNTTYYVRAYAMNSHGTGYGNLVSFTTHPDSFSDARDGIVYRMVTIGNQIWMGENLKYLPAVSEPSSGSETAPHYYVQSGAGFNYAYSNYGVLYNWPAAMNGASGSNSNPSGVQGVCPDGWHLPSRAEWDELIALLGGQNVAGGKLKHAGSEHWAFPNAGATDERDFSALPGGFRWHDGEFYDLWHGGRWWSSSEFVNDLALHVQMRYDDSSIISGAFWKSNGYSVRCIRD